MTHTLAVDAGGVRLLAPVLVRRIDASAGGEEGELRDAVSPYGYPGIVAAPAEHGEPEGAAPAGAGAGAERAEAALPLDPETVDWAPTGLVSLFLRHRLGAEPPLAGATARSEVQIADPELPRKSRMSDRQQIRRNLREGWRVRAVPGPETTGADREAFHAAYTETMARTGADPSYFFGPDRTGAILASPLSWLFCADAPGGEPAAASIAVRSDGMLHYHLSGTADAHLRAAPMKNILADMTDFAWERGLPLNLGGGLAPGDRLEEFKRGFANRRETWHTSEVICDRAAYERLSGRRGEDASGFFPAYRAPAPQSSAADPH